MKHRLSRPRAVVAGIGTATLAAAALALPQVNAVAVPEPQPAALTPVAAGKLSATIASRLGDAAAGAYYEADSKRLVVNVLNERAAATARKAGAATRVVKNSLAELDRARKTLVREATIPGTSWSSDPRVNKVVVTADNTVSGAERSKLAKVVAELGPKAVLRRVDSEIKPLLAGGDAISSGSGRCSLGFNVAKDGDDYFLTAGHCGDTGDTWSASRGGPVAGVTVGSSFPGNDYSIARYTAGVSNPSAVNRYDGSRQAITQAAEPIVGQQVERSGSTTQVHGGVVTGLNETVNYQQGSVHGLIKTSVCAEPGDSGGPLFDGDTALGLTSGGSGDCTYGGTTYFQPVTEALQAYGARIG